MALVLFFLAVGYANNLIYIFVFFLISVALTSVLITNKNVDGVEIENIYGENLFAEERSALVVHLKNHFTAPAWNLVVFFEKTEERAELSSLNPASLVYPAKKGDPQFPQKSYGSEDLKNSGLFRDHREYQSSDSTMRIDWRASARRQELLVKNFEEMEKPSLRFSWEQTSHLTDFESRISQLCLWIDEAEKRGHAYSLDLNNIKTPLERGPSHWKTCLESLAILNSGDVS